MYHQVLQQCKAGQKEQIHSTKKEENSNFVGIVKLGLGILLVLIAGAIVLHVFFKNPFDELQKEMPLTKTDTASEVEQVTEVDAEQIGTQQEQSGNLGNFFVDESKKPKLSNLILFGGGVFIIFHLFKEVIF